MSARLLPLAEAELPATIDPHATRGALAAEAEQRGGRAVVADVTVPGLRIAYPLLLTAPGDSGVLARTPEYGGPFPLHGTAGRAALAAVRAELDLELPRHGVVSEVFMLSPELPARDEVADAWGTSDGKEIRVVDPAAVARGEGLRRDRRSDLNKVRRTADAEVTAFGPDDARAFAARYAVAMDTKDAEVRWRERDARYFGALTGPDTLYSVATTPDGGAAAIFLLAGHLASYAFSVRWGAGRGATSLVIDVACRVLAERGVTSLTLGGGTTESSDDPLLGFKRSWGGQPVAFRLGARLYDAEAHAALVAADAARPLPVGAVQP